jgi:hypothetical protein
MHLIAHRGWAAGSRENTLDAFELAAGDSDISGVELDVCRAAGTGALLVSHDPPRHAQGVLTLDAALSFLSGTHLELFVELKEEGLAPAVIDTLVSHKVAERSVVFAFAEVARSFPWRDARPVRLGVIVMYPWQLDRAVREFAPDVLLLGWDDRSWTRMAFRAWWSLFSLERLGSRHRLPIVAGIVQRSGDLGWLSRQHVYAAVADIDRVREELMSASCGRAGR